MAPYEKTEARFEHFPPIAVLRGVVAIRVFPLLLETALIGMYRSVRSRLLSGQYSNKCFHSFTAMFTVQTVYFVYHLQSVIYLNAGERASMY